MKTIWEKLSGRLRASEPYQRLRSSGGGSAIRLPLAAAAWVTGLLAQDLARPVLVIVPHEADAVAWLEASELYGLRALEFPAPSLTPYQHAEASLAVRAQEALCLDRISLTPRPLVVATVRSLFRRVPSLAEFLEGVLDLAPGRDIEPADLASHLTRWGYRRADLVSEVGEFAVRGGVFDLFSPGEEEPLRLDFFADTVETVRHFDPVSQRSAEPAEHVRVVPLGLFPSGGQAAERLAALWSEWAGTTTSSLEELLAALRSGGFPGWEGYLAWAYGARRTLAQLLADPLRVIVDPETTRREAERHRDELVGDAEMRREQRLPVPEPEAIEQPLSEVLGALEHPDLAIGQLLGAAPGDDVVDFGAALTDRFEGQLPRFPREVETARARGERMLIVGPAEQRKRIADFCSTFSVKTGAEGVEIVEGDLQRGFRLPAAGVAVYGERQLFARLAPRVGKQGVRYGPFLSSLRDLKIGDFVVHQEHGIGQYIGLRTIGGDGHPVPGLPPALAPNVPHGVAAVEVMEIAYSHGRSLLVPLARVDEIQKYSGIEGVAPRLDQLGGTSWSRTKERVRSGLRRMAGDLLRLYAERQLATAPAMPPDSDLQAQFEAAFEFEETPDQLEAVADIKRDLESERPMDRLLCGDVGYGKTEVAMRAAFKVVSGGCRVAVLAPTTILSDQHLETFRRRFGGFPVSIEMVSRFRSSAEIRAIRERLAAGKIDILIGTHRLLSSDIEIPRLGLLVVDEEQRFGVAQKERLKQMKKEVHVLAMSATPVPRTLQLSLAGVRDLSVIETPPRDRMAIETAILPFGREVLREAIEYELERGGQVYFVHNRVAGIEEVAELLRDVVPSLRITIGHGQMDERELARRMHAFRRGDYDLLLATTIIENGIDISNVNTILIHQADRFGLAQLYQLRGRVGRSNQLAYCYLLVDPGRTLTREARQRLDALREFTDLGAGFRIAARDLEIRGAGNLLGAEQSGHIAAVGIETYLKMLEDAVRELRGEEVEEGPSAAIDLPVSTAIPESYIGDANLRLEIYRRLVAADPDGGEVLAELQDRFGPPPDSVHRLLEMAALKRLAEHLRVQSISLAKGNLQIRLRRDCRIDVDRLIAFVSERTGASFSPSGVLTLASPPRSSPLDAARLVLEELAS